MTFTPLTTRATGYKVTAPDWNALVDAINLLAEAPTARVTHGSAQSIANATESVIAFNTEVFDSHALHDTVTNNSRITIPSGEDGHYLIGANLEWAGDVDGIRRIWIRKNGTDQLAEVVSPSNGATTVVRQSVVTVAELAAGDYVEVAVTHNAGAGLNVNNTTGVSPVFWIVRVKV